VLRSSLLSSPYPPDSTDLPNPPLSAPPQKQKKPPKPPKPPKHPKHPKSVHTHSPQAQHPIPLSTEHSHQYRRTDANCLQIPLNPALLPHQPKIYPANPSHWPAICLRERWLEWHFAAKKPDSSPCLPIMIIVFDVGAHDEICKDCNNCGDAWWMRLGWGSV